MQEEITVMIKKIVIRDIQIAIIRKKSEGYIITEEIINEILTDLEANFNQK